MTIKAWVINKGQKNFDRIDMDLKKQIILKPGIPMQLPVKIAMNYVRNFHAITFCNNPEKYFNDRKLKQLIIRDAGIGDLLLLEPVIRALDDNNRDISMLSMFPDVFEFNPYVKENIQMHSKENISNVKYEDYDCFEDLRNYSETAASRIREHRTDIYNEKFNVQVSDKQPRIYTNGKEKSILNKKKGKRYIGIQLDASHTYRRFFKTLELIDYILEQDKNNIIVLLGAESYVKYKKTVRVIDYQTKTTVRQALNIIKDLDYMIAVDSGLMHIALTLHIPTVCIFNIITPDFRMRYYRGEYRIVTANIDCIGCGDYHMHKCQHGDAKRNPTFIPPCSDIPFEFIYNEMLSMKILEKVRIFKNKNDTEIDKNININLLPDKKLTMPLIVLNEEKNLPRFIELVINNKNIGKVIAIDGGSTDNTVELLEKAGALVYVHSYDKEYHDMQAVQRNYSCSFIEDDTNIIIMDIDECFSEELEGHLQYLANITDVDYGIISRRTYKYYKDINNPSKQIKDYPDWQPRFFKWNRKFKWVGSPHHNIYNCPHPVRIQKDIIHFECEGKDREALETQWSRMQKKTKEIYHG